MYAKSDEAFLMLATESDPYIKKIIEERRATVTAVDAIVPRITAVVFEVLLRFAIPSVNIVGKEQSPIEAIAASLEMRNERV